MNNEEPVDKSDGINLPDELDHLKQAQTPEGELITPEMLRECVGKFLDDFVDKLNELLTYEKTPKLVFPLEGGIFFYYLLRQKLSQE